MRFDRVIVADWSAASTVGPKSPTSDRCWLAFADADTPPDRRPPPEYFRTRHDAEARVTELATAPGSALIALDFAIGYPRSERSAAVLPEGRTLCAQLADRIVDAPDGTNNRFAVAGALNQTIRAQTDASIGPFWGHPIGQEHDGLPFRKPSAHGCREFRAVEAQLRRSGHNIRSPWQLAGAGAVGSQSLLGLPMVHRLLTAAGARGVLWPFDPVPNFDEPPDPIVIAECWPSLVPFDHIDHPIKDAQQVVALRDHILNRNAAALLACDHPDAAGEGWILGVEPER